MQVRHLGSCVVSCVVDDGSSTLDAQPGRAWSFGSYVGTRDTELKVAEKKG